MSPEQRKLARHALGLPNERKKSYRNRFIASGGNPVWDAMVTVGDACEVRSGGSRSVTYYLTKAGAMAALDPKEKLDSEDFPS